MSQKQLFAASVAALMLACVAGWAVSDEQAYLVADYSLFSVSEAQARIGSLPTSQNEPVVATPVITYASPVLSGDFNLSVGDGSAGN